MKVGEIVTRVKAAIDELAVLSDSELGGDENASNMEKIIIDKIPYALNWAYLNAQQNMVDSDMISSYTGGQSEGDKQLKMTFGVDNVVTVVLPDNFLRLISAKLSSWFYCPTPVSEFSETALMQQGRTTKGCPDAPVSVLSTKDGRSVLLMYTADSEDDALEINLINSPGDVTKSATNDTDIAISDKLSKSFIYYIAYLTLLAYRDSSADKFLAVAMDEIGLTQQTNQ